MRRRTNAASRRRGGSRASRVRGSPVVRGSVRRDFKGRSARAEVCPTGSHAGIVAVDRPACAGMFRAARPRWLYSRSHRPACAGVARPRPRAFECVQIVGPRGAGMGQDRTAGTRHQRRLPRSAGLDPKCASKWDSSKNLPRVCGALPTSRSTEHRRERSAPRCGDRPVEVAPMIGDGDRDPAGAGTSGHAGLLRPRARRSRRRRARSSSGAPSPRTTPRAHASSESRTRRRTPGHRDGPAPTRRSCALRARARRGA